MTYAPFSLELFGLGAFRGVGLPMTVSMWNSALNCESGARRLSRLWTISREFKRRALARRSSEITLDRFPNRRLWKRDPSIRVSKTETHMPMLSLDVDVSRRRKKAGLDERDGRRGARSLSSRTPFKFAAFVRETPSRRRRGAARGGELETAHALRARQRRTVSLFGAARWLARCELSAFFWASRAQLWQTDFLAKMKKTKKEQNRNNS